MRIGVKFCGGCNPRYDRGALLKDLKKYFAARVDFLVLRENTHYDGLLLIVGCPTACVEMPEIEFEIKKIICSDREDISRIITEIENYLEVKE